MAMTPHLCSPARQGTHCPVQDHFIFVGHQELGVRGEKETEAKTIMMTITILLLLLWELTFIEHSVHSQYFPKHFTWTISQWEV